MKTWMMDSFWLASQRVMQMWEFSVGFPGIIWFSLKQALCKARQEL